MTCIARQLGMVVALFLATAFHLEASDEIAEEAQKRIKRVLDSLRFYEGMSAPGVLSEDQKASWETKILADIKDIAKLAARYEPDAYVSMQRALLGNSKPLHGVYSTFRCKAYLAAGFPSNRLLAQFRAKLQRTRDEPPPADFTNAVRLATTYEMQIRRWKEVYGRQKPKPGFPEWPTLPTQAEYQRATSELPKVKEKIAAYEAAGYEHDRSALSCSIHVRKDVLKQLEDVGTLAIPILVEVRSWSDYPLSESLKNRTIVPRQGRFIASDAERQKKEIVDYVNERLRILGYIEGTPVERIDPYIPPGLSDLPVGPKKTQSKELHLGRGIRDEQIREIERQKRPDHE